MLLSRSAEQAHKEVDGENSASKGGLSPLFLGFRMGVLQKMSNIEQTDVCLET
jgi:hypothetical protein